MSGEWCGLVALGKAISHSTEAQAPQIYELRVDNGWVTPM